MRLTLGSRCDGRTATVVREIQLIAFDQSIGQLVRSLNFASMIFGLIFCGSHLFTRIKRSSNVR